MRFFARVLAVIPVCLALQGCVERNPVFGGDDDGGLRPDALAESLDAASLDEGLADLGGSDDLSSGCNVGKVRFVLEVRAGGRPDRYCHDGCQTWLRIRDEAERPLMLPSIFDCTPSCADCLQQPCPGIACTPSPIDAPLQIIWEGNYVEADLCGVGVNCAADRCAAPGQYVATMCASRNMAGPNLDECVPAMPPICVSVPFVLAPSGVVEVRGELPSIQ